MTILDRPDIGTSGGPGSILAAATDRSTLRRMDAAELTALAERMRGILLDTVTVTGGHLGPNLGVVELTIALHRVFDPAADRLVFDVGHQCYPHKLLTGRADAFARLRTAGGPSGYPARAESGADVVENSHASTALSYADGLVAANALAGRDDKVVAIVGDGALTGGLCWEALNNLGTAGRPVVVVLNDNGRSYSPTVGSRAEHLRALRDGTASGNVFSDLGLRYIGPVDGHDTEALEDALSVAAAAGGPVVVHAVTRKGHGYGPAEADEADHMHAVGPVDRATGLPTGPGGRSWTSVFATEIQRIGDERPDVVCTTAGMLAPTGLDGFAARHPERVADVGIAEQHAVTRAAGLAMGGMHPVVAIYSTFLNRAFDQVLMDVALHELPVTLVLDRAGVTGPDGPSHHGVWDLSVLGMIPGMRVAAPRDPANLRAQLREAVDTAGPTALRFPKASVGSDLPAEVRVGSVDVLRTAPERDVLLVSVGPLAPACVAAAERAAEQGVGVTVVDPRWVLPISADLTRMATEYRSVVTVEDGVAAGGVGTHLREALSTVPGGPAVRTLALPRRFVPHGTRTEILRRYGLDVDGLTASVLRSVGRAGGHVTFSVESVQAAARCGDAVGEP